MPDKNNAVNIAKYPSCDFVMNHNVCIIFVLSENEEKVLE